jgi:putative copper export protein/methionine-rich copper-binding protein CopC
MRASRASVVVITAVLTTVAAGVALAHATLRRSDPPNGGHVTQPPAELRLEFSEAVAARTSRVDLVAPDSQRFSLNVRGDSGTAKILIADVPPLAVAGEYRAEWRLVGSDGHAVTGQYGFTIDSIPVVRPVDVVEELPAASQPPHEPSSDSLVQQAIRFASSLALVVVIGSMAFALFVLPAFARASSVETTGVRDVVDSRLRALCRIGAWSVLVLALVRLVSHGAVLSGSIASLQLGDLGDLVAGSTFGRGWLLQMAAATTLLLRLRRGTSARWTVPGVAAVALAISASFLGHPAAVANLTLVAMGLDSVHVLAAGGWAGGILVLATVALPQAMAVPATDRVSVLRSLLRAFTPLALTCAAVLAVTGAAAAWLQLRDLGLVLGSPYGLMLVRKLVVVAVVAALGAYHWRVVQPSVGSDRSVVALQRSIAVDAAFVLLVLVLTAILTGTAPPVR